MARVLHLFRAPKRRAPMEELASAEVVKDAGFEAARMHGRGTARYCWRMRKPWARSSWSRASCGKTSAPRDWT